MNQGKWGSQLLPLPKICFFAQTKLKLIILVRKYIYKYNFQLKKIADISIFSVKFG